MYKQFFGFTNEVFSKSIKVEQLFKSKSFNDLINRLEYMKKYRGIMLITGDPGMGKTSAIRYFTSNLSTKSFFPIYLPLSTVAVGDFYRQLNASLHGEKLYGKSNVYDSIQKQIINLSINRSLLPVIIFDEAHLLKHQNFNELQIICNFQYDTQCPALFIISGQSVLRDRVRGYNLASFNQRISLKYHMEKLSEKETKDYILHHFSICNCSSTILTDAAFKSVYDISEGNPRVVGNIVIKSLLLATSKKEEKIDEEMVISASQEIL
jgi:type II secretory pathway predicted ATPase ExeA